MATIKEQAAAIKGYAADIDAAIVAKGGTTDGGLRHAAAAIEALPSGESSGGPANALPIGCPRIDLIPKSNVKDEVYVAIYIPGEDESFNSYVETSGNCTVSEVIVNDSGSIVSTVWSKTGRPVSWSLTGVGYHVIKIEHSTVSKITRCVIFNNNIKPKCPIVFRGCCVDTSNPIRLLIAESHYDGTYGLFGGSIAAGSPDLESVIFNGGMNLPRALFNAIVPLLRLKLVGSCVTNTFEYFNPSRPYEYDFSQLDMSACTSVQAFPTTLCRFVMPIDSNKGLRVSFSCTSSRLSKDSLLSIVNSLYDHVTAGTGNTPKLTIGTTNLAKLTDEEKAIATDKGWQLA